MSLLIDCYFLYSSGTHTTLGINILGVVENMSDIKIPFASVGLPASGLRMMSRTGQDVTTIMMDL
jgi:hypothetical protein